MMRTREARIRTFMQLELEACLEEVSWMIRCHNCEALDCPQEEYPARLLPTPPPSYIGNLQSRLIKTRKGIFPASLKMILKTKYPLPVRRPAPETSVQPEDVIEEHRAGENSPLSQCDPSPRRAAVDTGSEESGMPPQSPAIGTGSEEPGASRAPFKTSIGGFINSNFTSTEQEWALLHQPDVGVDDGEKETTATSQQVTVHEEFVLRRSDSSKERQLGLPSRTSNLTGASYRHTVTFLEKRNVCRVYCPACCFSCLLPIAYFSRLVHKKCRSRYERRY